MHLQLITDPTIINPPPHTHTHTCPCTRFVLTQTHADDVTHQQLWSCIHSFDGLEGQPLEYVSVTSVKAGTQGLIFMVGFAVEAKPVGGTSVGGGYIEGCWQFYRSATEPFPGLVVGTGLEDYFDSSFYFGGDTPLQHGVPFTNALAGQCQLPPIPPTSSFC